MKPYRVHVELEIEVEAINEQEACALVEENINTYIAELPDFEDANILDASARPVREDNIPPEDQEEKE